MTNLKPLSFKVFLIVVSVTVFNFIAALLLSYNHANIKYSMVLALLQFIAMSGSLMGIYTGFKYNSDDKKNLLFNKIGLIGCLVIFSLTIVIMAIAAFA